MNATATATPPTPIAATVMPDHLSWSGVKTYADCPKKFHYRYIEQAPAEFVPASLAFGSSIHSATELCHEARLEDRQLPPVETLVERYDECWRAEVSQSPAVRYAKHEDAETLHDLAGRMLTVYGQHVLDTARQSVGSQIIGIEHEALFRLIPNVPPIKMRLDLLELAGSDLIVTDLKTSRSRWNDMKVQEQLPQLVLYAHGLMPLLRDLGAKRIVPRFCVVTKGKAPAVQVLEPRAGQDDVDRLKRQVAETWDAVTKGVFVQREGWGCAQCPFRKRCLGTPE